MGGGVEPPPRLAIENPRSLKNPTFALKKLKAEA